jgi:hypothetical protein
MFHLKTSGVPKEVIHGVRVLSKCKVIDPERLAMVEVKWDKRGLRLSANPSECHIFCSDTGQTE